MQEIPFSAAVGNVVQHVHRLAEVAAVDVVGCRLQPHFLLGISIIIPCGAAVFLPLLIYIGSIGFIG